MIRRPARIAPVVLGTLLASGLATGPAAGPARADTGPVGTAGCSGIQCWAQLGVRLHEAGGASGTPNTGYSLASVPPPPCWYTPFASATAMKAFVAQQMQSPGAAADGVPQTLAGIEPQVNKEAKANGGQGAAGEWYTLTEPTPAAPDSLSCIQQNEGANGAGYYVWIGAGQPAPPANVPPRDLALYALSQMTLPAPKVHINPAGKTFVSLPTYVTAGVPRAVQITAALGNAQVTVTATPTGLAISAPDPQAYENGTKGTCKPQGSTASQATINAAGPGQKPDCGFVFQAPTTGPITITAQETWTATWSNGGTANPVPQEPTPTAANPAPAVTVNEIQSVNNGAG